MSLYIIKLWLTRPAPTHSRNVQSGSHHYSVAVVVMQYWFPRLLCCTYKVEKFKTISLISYTRNVSISSTPHGLCFLAGNGTLVFWKFQRNIIKIGKFISFKFEELYEITKQKQNYKNSNIENETARHLGRSASSHQIFLVIEKSSVFDAYKTRWRHM